MYEISDMNRIRALLCELVQPEVAESNDACEIQLLKNNNPKKDVCSLKVIPTSQLFTRMTHRNSYLFNLQMPREIKLLISENRLVVETIKDTGIIELIGEGEIHMNHRVYRTTSEKLMNLKIETPEKVKIDNLYLQNGSTYGNTSNNGDSKWRYT